jgi:hypothetical protein
MMITHFTAAVAEEKRHRWMAEARVAHAARLARQARRSHRPARSRVSAHWFLGRLHRGSVTDPATATPGTVIERNPQSLPRRTGELSNHVAIVSAEQHVVGAPPVPMGSRL